MKAEIFFYTNDLYRIKPKDIFIFIETRPGPKTKTFLYNKQYLYKIKPSRVFKMIETRKGPKSKTKVILVAYFSGVF